MMTAAIPLQRKNCNLIWSVEAVESSSSPPPPPQYLVSVLVMDSPRRCCLVDAVANKSLPPRRHFLFHRPRLLRLHLYKRFFRPTHREELNFVRSRIQWPRGVTWKEPREREQSHSRPLYSRRGNRCCCPLSYLFDWYKHHMHPKIVAFWR